MSEGSAKSTNSKSLRSRQPENSKSTSSMDAPRGGGEQRIVRNLDTFHPRSLENEIELSNRARRKERDSRSSSGDSLQEANLETVVVVESEWGDYESESGVRRLSTGAQPGAALDPFSQLPDEVVLNVLVHLDALMVGRAAQVSSRWNALTFDDDLWHELARGWSHISPDQLGLGHDRYYYVQRFLDQRTAEKQSQLAAARDRRNRKKQRAARFASVFLSICFFSRLADYTNFSLFVLGTLLVTLKLGPCEMSRAPLAISDQFPCRGCLYLLVASHDPAVLPSAVSSGSRGGVD